MNPKKSFNYTPFIIIFCLFALFFWLFLFFITRNQNNSPFVYALY